MEQIHPLEVTIDTFAVYVGAIDDLFDQHTNQEVDGLTFVTQAAAIVQEFEQSSAHQTQLAELGAHLRTMVNAMACCNPETSAAFQNNPFFTPVEDHTFCDDDHETHNDNPSSKKKKKRANKAASFLLKFAA